MTIRRMTYSFEEADFETAALREHLVATRTACLIL